MPSSGHSSGAPPNGSVEAAALVAFLRSTGKSVALSSGEELFRESAPCRGAFWIEEGEVELTIASGERHTPLGKASAGQLLGLASVVRDAPYECSAVARTNCHVLEVEAEAMRKYLRQHPESCLQSLQFLGSDILDLSSKVIRPLRLQPRYPKSPDKS